MDDAARKAREIVLRLGAAYQANGRRYVDEAAAEAEIANAIREAREDAFRDAASILRGLALGADDAAAAIDAAANALAPSAKPTPPAT